MNGRNGNILGNYYGNHGRRPNWSTVLTLCTFILALLGIVWYAIEKITDLKIENSALKWRNEFLEQTKERRYTPDGYR